MEIINTDIPDVVIIKPTVYYDNRGLFFESFNIERLSKLGITENFVQDNQSVSSKGVVRALHFQNPPFAQGKLVRVIRGAVLDVAVDIRKSSPFYGKYVSCELNGDNNLMMWMPFGFAHGFVSLQDDSIVLYKTTNYFNKESEGSIRWDDPDININWGVSNPVLSPKDKASSLFKDFISKF